MPCDNCAALTRQVRELREELAEWRSPRVSGAALAERQEMWRNKQRLVDAVSRTYPGLKGVSARLVGALMASEDPMTRREIMNALNSDGDSKMIDVVVCNARKHIPAGAIRTVWGAGYQWIRGK